MSSSANAPKDGKERRGMGKVLYRVKTVFRKGDGSKKGRSSTAPAPEPTAEPALMSAPAPAPVPAPAKKKRPSYEGATKIPRIQVHEERAKKLGTRYGLEIKPSEWHITEGDVLRIDKPVRMRVHRECHRCHAMFGAGKQCPKCQHTRCNKCPRYPLKLDEEERQANRQRRDALIQKHKDMAPIIPSYDYSPEKVVLKRPSKKTGAQDLVYKGRPRIRVRRYCHECNSLITPHGKQARVCDNCGHRRCGDCPRNPDAKHKYPFGYPNDEPGPTSKGTYICHICKDKFPSNPGEGAECLQCSHPRCDQCRRVKPRKVDPDPDPELLESVRRQLEKLKTGDES